MGIMNKMRERMTVIFAGLAGAFLLMIVFEWGAQGDFFRASRPEQGVIGKVEVDLEGPCAIRNRRGR